MKCHSMKRNFNNFRNQIDHMPLHNRSHGSNKLKSDGDIALSTHKKQVFLEKEVTLDDTLQSIALEFNTPVAELKRINNIHKDNEIFARKVIKVPSNPLSILFEKDYFSEKKENEISMPIQSAHENFNVIIETVNNSSTVLNSMNNKIHIQGEDEEDAKFSPNFPTEKDKDQESASLLATTVVAHNPNDVMSCNGADWGISWHALLLVTLMLGLGGPFFYVFWLIWGKKEKLDGS